MPEYTAPVDETMFILDDVLNFQKYNNIDGFEEASSELIRAILEETAKFTQEVLFPLNRVGDIEGCKRNDDGSVTTPTGFKNAYDQYVEAGWGALAAPTQYGGQNLPSTLSLCLSEYVISANMSFGMYPGLTKSAASAIIKHGSDEINNTYTAKMLSGEWSGTMNLTEPHCGTDLGLLKTKATPNDDGSFGITGQKIFISAGEHDLTENIIHLVLARIEGEPEGTKGISLFIVPKKILNDNNEPGEMNGVSCGAIEEKMGIHGNSTCVLNYDNAKGWLVGEKNKGLRAMFVMMNEARLGVGLQGLAMSEVAYQNAVTYCKERLQGRSVTGAKEPDKPADPIIKHPDIRRTLLSMKAFNEASRALILWTSLRGDIAERSEDPEQKQNAEDMMALLTPIIKGVLTDKGFENTVAAQQTYGGHGYIGEHGMEQYVRDARIAMLYEGTNGIQALDLVGRKLPKDGGRAVRAYFEEVTNFCEQNKNDEDMKHIVEPLTKSLGHLQEATMWLAQHGIENPDNAAAGATDYMHLFGIVTLGHMWGLITKAANEKISQGNGNAEFYKNKLITGKFFAERFMPETETRLNLVKAGAETMMSFWDVC